MALATAGGSARANGAFPGGQTILAPRDLPGEILMATNFGVVESRSAGRTWTWTCEQPANSYGRLYQMGPAPGHRLFAIAGSKLIYSDDRSCTWQAGAGTLSGTSVQDAFVDPNDGKHVLAVAVTFGDAGPAYRVVASHDGGATFEPPIFTADPGDLITGVEIAVGDSDSIDLALGRGSQLIPTLARSVDGGATWTLIDLSGALGTSQIRILGIDPLDPDRVFLRGIGPTGDVLAVFDEAEPPARVPLTFANGQMTAFVKTAAATVLAAGTSKGAAQLFRSHDGLNYEPIAGAPAIISMAERQGVIYAATDTTVHPFGEALSQDDGSTWTPGLRFAQIDAIAGCLAAACQDDCRMRAAQQQWPAAMCAAAPPVDPAPVMDAGSPPTRTDASSPATDAGPPAVLTDAAAPRDGMGVHAPTDAGVPPQPRDAGDVRFPPPASGCSCATSPGPGESLLLALLAVAVAVALLRRDRGPRAGDGPSA
ncbi:MAG TPA: sialidase family protein [Polyangia bacterium]|nr:sialidase family protein [Polyangia bacterium]